MSVAVGSFAQGALSDRGMPRPDEATEQPKKLVERKEETASLKKLPNRPHAPWQKPLGIVQREQDSE
jgi:hypothetical protein